MSEFLSTPPILHYRHLHDDRHLPDSSYSLPDDPLADGRSVHFHDPVQGFASGSSSSAGKGLLIEAFPWIELSIVEAGELQLQGEGFDLQLVAGDCFVVPSGIQIHWREHGPVRRLFMAFPGLQAADDSLRKPLKIDCSQALQSCEPPAASVLLTAPPKAWSETLFSTGNLRIGLWQCEAYSRRQVEPGYSELMFFLDGEVTLTNQTGEPYRIHKGEAVVVPRGATNAWSSEQTVRKVFCILS